MPASVCSFRTPGPLEHVLTWIFKLMAQFDFFYRTTPNPISLHLVIELIDEKENYPPNLEGLHVSKTVRNVLCESFFVPNRISNAVNLHLTWLTEALAE